MHRSEPPAASPPSSHCLHLRSHAVGNMDFVGLSTNNEAVRSAHTGGALELRLLLQWGSAALVTFIIFQATKVETASDNSKLADLWVMVVLYTIYALPMQRSLRQYYCLTLIRCASSPAHPTRG